MDDLHILAVHVHAVEAGEELPTLWLRAARTLVAITTFFRFPKTQWKTLRTTNTIERLHGEFRRRVKTQGSLPTEDASLVLLFSLVASGQIKLRKIDGWQKIGGMLNQHTTVAA